MRAEITPGSVARSSSARWIGSTLPAINDSPEGGVVLAGRDNYVLRRRCDGTRPLTGRGKVICVTRPASTELRRTVKNIARGAIRSKLVGERILVLGHAVFLDLAIQGPLADAEHFRRAPAVSPRLLERHL